MRRDQRAGRGDGAGARRAGRLPKSAALVLAWLFVATVGTGAVGVGEARSDTLIPIGAVVSGPASAPDTPGVSRAVDATQSTARVGALFGGSLSAGHYCTASVVDSAAKDVIVTAAHCLTG